MDLFLAAQSDSDPRVRDIARQIIELYERVEIARCRTAETRRYLRFLSQFVYKSAELAHASRAQSRPGGGKPTV